MHLPPEIFTIIREYLSLHDISSLVLTCNEVNKWVNMNDVIREYYLAIGDGEVNDLVKSACKRGCLNLLIYLRRIGTCLTDGDNLPIIWASKYGHLSVVKYLHFIGANVTIWGNLPIRAASEKGHLSVVKYLHSVGANVTAKHNYAIRCANYYGHTSVVEYLRENGADFFDGL